MKQLITVVLDLTRWRVDPETFQFIQLDISMLFYVRKPYQVRVAIRKTIGTLGQMAITHFNNSNIHNVNKTWKPEKAAQSF